MYAEDIVSVIPRVEVPVLSIAIAFSMVMLIVLTTYFMVIRNQFR